MGPGLRRDAGVLIGKARTEGRQVPRKPHRQAADRPAVLSRQQQCHGRAELPAQLNLVMMKGGAPRADSADDIDVRPWSAAPRSALRITVHQTCTHKKIYVRPNFEVRAPQRFSVISHVQSRPASRGSKDFQLFIRDLIENLRCDECDHGFVAADHFTAILVLARSTAQRQLDSLPRREVDNVIHRAALQDFRTL